MNIKKHFLLYSLFFFSMFFNSYAEDFSGQYNLDYTIQSGDVLKLDIAEHPEYSKNVLVDLDGCINHELFGRIKVKDKTIDQIRQIFAVAFEKFLYKYPFAVTIAEYHTKKVMVIGLDKELKDEKKKAVDFSFKGNYRLSEVLRELQIPLDPRFHYNIYIRRHPNFEMKINASELLFKGEMRNNIFINNNDILVIEKLFPLKKSNGLTFYYPANTPLKQEYSLLGVDSKELIETLKKTLSSNGSVVANNDFSVIYVEDMPEYIQTAENLIHYYHSNRENIRQILIEAKIFEVTLRDNEIFGVDWRSIADKYKLDYGLLNGDNYRYNLVAFSDQRVNYTTILDVVRERGKINTLSSPNIVTLNRKTAFISVGEQIPYRKTETTTTNSTVPVDQQYGTYEFKDVFLNFKVTPDIISDTLIKLDIEPEISNISGRTSDNNPIINTRKASSSVVLENNSYLFLGGILSEQKIKNTRGVPFFEKLPIINLAFRKDEYELVKTELVILLKCSVMSASQATNLGEKKSIETNDNYKKLSTIKPKIFK